MKKKAQARNGLGGGKRSSRYLRLSVLIPSMFVVVACVGATVRWIPLPLNRSAAPVLATPQQTPALKLTKEYIYAGDRLVATEEPGLAPPTNMIVVEWCQAHLYWRDNSQNETGFKFERLNTDGITWSVLGVFPANNRSHVGSR